MAGVGAEAWSGTSVGEPGLERQVGMEEAGGRGVRGGGAGGRAGVSGQKPPPGSPSLALAGLTAA